MKNKGFTVTEPDLIGISPDDLQYVASITAGLEHFRFAVVRDDEILFQICSHDDLLLVGKGDV